MKGPNIVDEASNFPEEYVERKSEIESKYIEMLREWAKEKPRTSEEYKTQKDRLYSEKEAELKALRDNWNQNQSRGGR